MPCHHPKEELGPSPVSECRAALAQLLRCDETELSVRGWTEDCIQHLAAQGFRNVHTLMVANWIHLKRAGLSPDTILQLLTCQREAGLAAPLPAVDYVSCLSTISTSTYDAYPSCVADWRGVEACITAQHVPEDVLPRQRTGSAPRIQSSEPELNINVGFYLLYCINDLLQASGSNAQWSCQPANPSVHQGIQLQDMDRATPDWVLTDEDGRVRAFVDVKRPEVVRSWRDRPASACWEQAVLTGRGNPFLSVLSQATAYASKTGCRYAAFTTYFDTWLLQFSATGQLEVSRAFQWTDTQPSTLQAMWYLTQQALGPQGQLPPWSAPRDLPHPPARAAPAPAEPPAHTPPAGADVAKVAGADVAGQQGTAAAATLASGSPAETPRRDSGLQCTTSEMDGGFRPPVHGATASGAHARALRATRAAAHALRRATLAVPGHEVRQVPRSLAHPATSSGPGSAGAGSGGAARSEGGTWLLAGAQDQRVVGHGMTGDAVAARLPDGREVVVKHSRDPVLQQHLAQEARILTTKLAHLQGREVVQLVGHGWGPEGRAYWLATGLLQGEHLDPEVHPHHAALWAPCVAALRAIHAAGVRHGDVRSYNILVTPHGRPAGGPRDASGPRDTPYVGSTGLPTPADASRTRDTPCQAAQTQRATGSADTYPSGTRTSFHDDARGNPLDGTAMAATPSGKNNNDGDVDNTQGPRVTFIDFGTSSECDDPEVHAAEMRALAALFGRAPPSSRLDTHGDNTSSGTGDCPPRPPCSSACTAVRPLTAALQSALPGAGCRPHVIGAIGSGLAGRRGLHACSRRVPRNERVRALVGIRAVRACIANPSVGTRERGPVTLRF